MDDILTVSMFFAGFALIMSYGAAVSERRTRVPRLYLGPLLPRLAPKTPTSSPRPELRPHLHLVAPPPPEATLDPVLRCVATGAPQLAS